MPPEPAETIANIVIGGFAVFIFFAVIPGTIAVISGFIIGIAAAIPILAIGSLTRLAGRDSTQDENH